MSEQQSAVGKAVQAERRRLLIDATMSAISEHGLGRLTLAKIAAVAGLSAGSVNFHFDSKEALLLETLEFLAAEFEQTIDRALRAAPQDPASQLQAICEASLDPDITEPRKMAVWFAFVSEARGRADYKRICGHQDDKIFAVTRDLCAELIRAGGKEDQMNARAMANAVQGLIDELWSEILYAGDKYDRADARFLWQSFLASVFPWAFATPVATPGRGAPLSTADDSLRVDRAGLEQLAALAALFDAYRQFYGESADPRLARKFIGDNIRRERSVIFLARDRDGHALGFTQLYPGWCSIAAAPVWTLSDLFVDAAVRRRGVARAILQEAERFARKSGACRIDLATAADNHRAQALYEQLGYRRDTAFYEYSLDLR